MLGPTSGRQQSFVLLAEWVPAPRRLGHEEALGELATRYFRGHGPATSMTWRAGPACRSGTCDSGWPPGRVGWLAWTLTERPITSRPRSWRLSPPAAPAPVPTPLPDVRLLPGFDEYLLGYGDRSAVLAPEHAQAVVPGSNGVFLPTIVVDGEVVGTWKRTARAREVVIEPSPFRPLADRVREGLVGAAGAYGAFLGLPARIA